MNHDLLLSKLNHYGIRWVVGNWFHSYLNNRKQYVTIGTTSSESLPIQLGVPQRSLLGLLLFLLYINGICDSSSLLTFHLFADDSNLFYKNKYLNVLETTINNELSNVYTWICSNKLSLNIEKSNYIIFRSLKKKAHTITVNISKIRLKEMPRIKYLGVLLDSHLNWKAHISLLSTGKLKKFIGILGKARHYTNIEILRNLYYTLIYPYLTYRTLFWGHTYKTTLLPLFILQKKAIRIISFSHFNNHTDPIFLRLSILKLNDSLLSNCIVYVWFSYQ